MSKEATEIKAGALTLVLEAAEGRLQLVLGRDGIGEESEPEVLVAQSWAAQSQGAELLAPALQDALARLKLTPAHIGRLAAVTGPGSFTGLRLCTVTCSALARALQIPQAGLEYLPLLAEGLADAVNCPTSPGSDALVITHARRNLVYVQEFKTGLAKTRARTGAETRAATRATSGIEVLTLAQSMEKIRALAEHAAPLRLAGSGISRNKSAYAALLDACGSSVHLLPARFNHPDPRVMLMAASRAEYGDADLAPLYLRPSDAEENLAHVSGLLGLDAEASRSRLSELLAAPPDQES